MRGPSAVVLALVVLAVLAMFGRAVVESLFRPRRGKTRYRVVSGTLGGREVYNIQRDYSDNQWRMATPEGKRFFSDRAEAAGAARFMQEAADLKELEWRP